MRKTLAQLKTKKTEGKKLTMLTAYDGLFARVLDQAGIDFILIGDSLGTVLHRQENTLGVTMDQMAYHTRLVAAQVHESLVIADMPFLSASLSAEDTLRNAGRLMQCGAVQAVKIEAYEANVSFIKNLVDAGIPVIGHIGLTPQHVKTIGGYRVVGKDESEANGLLDLAKSLDQAGCFAILLELVPADLAKKVSENCNCLTIGIGSGPHCDGQVLVTHDMLGFDTGLAPKFVKKYAAFGPDMLAAVTTYKTEVESGQFPA